MLASCLEIGGESISQRRSRTATATATASLPRVPVAESRRVSQYIAVDAASSVAGAHLGR
jgi:hypothetical protein